MSTLETLRSALSGGDRVARIEFGLVVVDVTPEDVAAVAARIRNPLGFDVLLDITAIDWPQRTPRFDVVWHFYSTLAKVRVRMKTAVPASAPIVASLVPLYGAAAFMERETHDMYGIEFAGNDDLRPILLYEGFVGHPLRKDYAKDHEQPLVPYREP